MAFVFFKLFLYILILLSLSLQTTARRSQMLPNGTITTTNTDIPPSNDTESALTNDNNISSPTGTDDTEPTFTNDNNIISPTGTNDNESALTNDNNIISPTGTNDTESALTNDDATPTPTTANDNDTSYPETTAPQTDQDFFTPDPENANDTSSTPPRKENIFSPTPTPKVAPVSPLSPPPPLDLGDYYQNDMSFSPVPAPSDDHSSDGDFFDYENSPDPSAAPDTDDYDGDWTAPAAAKPTVLPSTYEADDEVDPELAAEIEAYTAARERNSGALVVVLGFACLVGVGGFVYKKRKQDMAKKSQYQYLSKRDENEL